MATYKLIQDIEADDKLLGPLSFRQFVYALVSVTFLYVSYLFYIHHAGVLDVVTIPIVLFAGFLAFPFGKDQPTEIWALAKLRFFLKPRRRIWAQSGVKELVTITAPKKIEVVRTDGLSQVEVKSRLQALANTIDSHGWAIKNTSNVFQNPLSSNDDSDRLVSASAVPVDVPDVDIPENEDMLDAQNPVLKQMDEMLSARSSQHREHLIDSLDTMREQATLAGINSDKRAALPEVPETQLAAKLKSAYVSTHSSLSNMRTLSTMSAQPTPNQPTTQPAAASTTIHSPVIMSLAQRNDLNVNVISHEADKANGTDEVLVSLR